MMPAKGRGRAMRMLRGVFTTDAFDLLMLIASIAIVGALTLSYLR